MVCPYSLAFANSGPRAILLGVLFTCSVALSMKVSDFYFIKVHLLCEIRYIFLFRNADVGVRQKYNVFVSGDN